MNAPRLERLKALVEAQPDDPRARYFLANELFRAEDWAGAAEQFGAYVGLSGGDDGAAYRSLGLAHQQFCNGNQDRRSDSKFFCSCWIVARRNLVLLDGSTRPIQP